MEPQGKGGAVTASASRQVVLPTIDRTLSIDPYPNLERIRQVACPVAVIHGGNDGVRAGPLAPALAVSVADSAVSLPAGCSRS